MAGDYEFLGRLEGISGASGNVVPYQTPMTSHYSLVGRHLCLWCLITSSDLKIPRAKRKNKYPLRTLESLRADYQSFMASGGELKDAKDHNNVIGECFFNIPLENV